MKTRAGFVSNSSTSSYVLVGFDAPEDLVERAKYATGKENEWVALRELGVRWLEGEESGCAEGESFIGFLLSRWDQTEGEGPEDHERVTSMAEATERCDELRIRLGLDECPEIKIICGVMAS